VSSLKQHIFLIVGLAVVIYFFSIDVEALKPTLVDYTIFAVGFFAMLTYVIQSFVRFRNKMRNEQKK